MTEHGISTTPMRWAPESWVEALGGKVYGAQPAILDSIGTDTRALQPGALFLALRGDTFDGHAFLQQAVDAGAAVVVVEDNEYSRAMIADAPAGVTVVVVDDTLFALGELARAWRNERSCFVTCITGSSGKTTTKDMTASIMRRVFSTVATRGNLNNRIGVPLTILGIRDEEMAVIELGMSIPGEIKRLAEIASPDSGVVTAVHPAHLEGMGSIAAVADAKLELMKAIEQQGGTVAWNIDDPEIASRRHAFDVGGFSFGLETDETDISAHGIVMDAQSTTFDLRIWEETRTVSLPMPGRHAVTDALAAAALATIHGIGIDDIAAGLAAVQVTPGRLRRLPEYRDIDVFDDTYNANPASMKAALDVLAIAAEGRRRIAVLGTMLELGETSRALHADVGRWAATRASLVFAYGPHAADIISGVAEQAGQGTAFEHMDALVAALSETIRSNDAVLLKGSRGMRMERARAGLAAFLITTAEGRE